jgi:hypothetical protein
LRLKTNVSENLIAGGFIRGIFDTPVFSKHATELGVKEYTVFNYRNYIDVGYKASSFRSGEFLIVRR